MRYQYDSPAGRELFGWRKPQSTVIRTLLILNLAIWIILSLTGAERLIFPLLGLVPRYVVYDFMLWQPLTYLFLHAGFWHVGMNMFVLWMFGSELENSWGGVSFLRYYLVTGVGAGLVTVLFSANSPIPVVGASGAIYGVLLAYGLAYPDRLVYLYFMFPIKVKYFVGFLAAVAFWASLQAGASPVSHLTHLSGMVIGWVYLRAKRRTAAPQLLARINDLKAARRIAREVRENRQDDLLRRQVDEILDKINSRGYDSLTSTEQDILYRASVRFSRKTDKD